jgi:hypothetical protein
MVKIRSSDEKADYELLLHVIIYMIKNYFIKQKYNFL